MKKNKTALETTLFPCISYSHWNRIYGDQDMFQPFLFAGAHPQILFPVFFSAFFVHRLIFFILSYWLGKLKPEGIDR